jgi:GDPmannose 4,6-dehydratase
VTKRALITGVAGQDGTYLSELLLSKGYEVWGVVGPAPGAFLEWAMQFEGRLHPINADLTDLDSLMAAVEVSAPDEVYNFAGLTSVGGSWAQPERYADVNGQGVVRLLEAVRHGAPGAHVVQASSAEVFGDPAHSPQTEQTALAPTNPYGTSKLIAHEAICSARGDGMLASNAILYNHESPLRPATFVTGKIADAAARIKLGFADELRLGNLDVTRDWGFAGDYVDAMSRIAASGQADDFVIATGVGHTVRDFAMEAFAHVGLDYSDYVVVDPEFFREADATALVGDPSRIRERLGWTPTVEFGQLVGMMVDANLERLGDGSAS